MESTTDVLDRIGAPRIYTRLQRARLHPGGRIIEGEIGSENFEEQLERARSSIWRASRLAYEDCCRRVAERNYIQNINL